MKRFTQRLDYPNPRTYVGKGKLEELKQYIEEEEIPLVIFDDELSPKQVANIEKELQVKVLDRTSLILDILPNGLRRPRHARKWNWRNISICCRGLRVCGLIWSASAAALACAAPVKRR